MTYLCRMMSSSLVLHIPMGDMLIWRRGGVGGRGEREGGRWQEVPPSQTVLDWKMKV